MAFAELVCSCPVDVEISASVGADRVEVCAALDVGGVTPGAGLLAEALDVARGRLDLVVLVRPRAGDFVLRSAGERRMALRDIEFAGRCGARGVAVGALDGDGALDVPFVRDAVAAAGAMHVTVHRAIDCARDPSAGLDALAEIGVRRVLTSGGAATAVRGAAQIASWVAQYGGELEIIAASGISGTNAARVLTSTGAGAIHGSCRSTGDTEAPLGMGRTPGIDRESARALVEAAHAHVSH